MGVESATQVWVFAGQGAPDLAGTRDFLAASPALREWLEAEVPDRDFLEACLEPGAARHRADLQQAGLGVCAAVAARALEWALPDGVRPRCVGPSLGELFALAASRACDWGEAIAIARTRGALMQMASGSRGAMSSVFNVPPREVEHLCDEAPGTAVVASEVSLGQVLISGEAAAVDWVSARCHERSGKRPLRLPISVAAHSPLMEGAVEAFRASLAAYPFRDPAPGVLSSVGGPEITRAEQIPEALVGQLTARVEWRSVVRSLCERGRPVWVGIGAAGPLLRQVAREYPQTEIRHAGTPAEVAEIADWIRKEESDCRM